MAAHPNGNGTSFSKNTEAKSAKVQRKQSRVPRWKEKEFAMMSIGMMFSDRSSLPDNTAQLDNLNDIGDKQV